MNTIIKMKKHPIDDLFAKKLAEHRQEPSQKAFEKFQARLQEKQHKRRGGFFAINQNWVYFAAAAGIFAVLTIGFLSQRNATNETTLASVGVPKKVGEKKPNIAKEADSQLVAVQKMTEDATENTIEQSEKITLKQTKVFLSIDNEVSVAKVENQPKTTENMIDDDSPIEQNSVAINTIFDTNIETIEVKKTDIFQNPIDESIVLILEPEPIEKEIIPAINEDSAISLADAKRLGVEKEENAKSFIAKLYGEYKHLKHGEKVDLKKIGVKDALAKVDESLFKEDREDIIGFVQRKVVRLQKRD